MVPFGFGLRASSPLLKRFEICYGFCTLKYTERSRTSLRVLNKYCLFFCNKAQLELFLTLSIIWYVIQVVFTSLLPKSVSPDQSQYMQCSGAATDTFSSSLCLVSKNNFFTLVQLQDLSSHILGILRINLISYGLVFINKHNCFKIYVLSCSSDIPDNLILFITLLTND